MVGLGHERDAPAVEVGDLLGAVLEHDAPVGRFEDVVVADVDLVLAVGRLALAELDRDVRLGHLIAQQAVERLGLRGLEQVVVLVVVAEGPRDRPTALGQLLPGVLEDVELELGAGLDRVARVRGARDLPLEDRPRRDRDLLAGLLVDRVGQDHGRPGQPRQDPQLVPDRFGDPVAVAGLPVHQAEPLGRGHLHVGAEEVRAEVGAVADDAVEEGLALDALAHEPALHVGEGHDDRVDPPVADHALELGESWVPDRVAVLVVAHRDSSWVDSRAGRRTGRPSVARCTRRQAVVAPSSPAARSNSRSISVSSASRALASRPGEPSASPDEVVDHQQDEEPGDGRQGGRIQPERIQEQWGDRDDPDHRDDREWLADTTQAPGPLVPPSLVAPQPEEDAHAVRRSTRRPC